MFTHLIINLLNQVFRVFVYGISDTYSSSGSTAHTPTKQVGLDTGTFIRLKKYKYK